MKPQFSEAAKRLAFDKAGAIGAVDATAYEALAREFNIKGFPTLKYFKNGVLYGDYNGKRTADDFYNFVKNDGISGAGKDEL